MRVEGRVGDCEWEVLAEDCNGETGKWCKRWLSTRAACALETRGTTMGSRCEAEARM